MHSKQTINVHCKRSKRSTFVIVRLTADEKAKLSQVAGSHQLSMSSVVRKYLASTGVIGLVIMLGFVFDFALTRL